MDREQFRHDLHTKPRTGTKPPIHFGRYFFIGNAPAPWGEYTHYNPKHLPTLISDVIILVNGVYVFKVYTPHIDGDEEEILYCYYKGM